MRASSVEPGPDAVITFLAEFQKAQRRPDPSLALLDALVKAGLNRPLQHYRADREVQAALVDGQLDQLRDLYRSNFGAISPR